MRGSSDDHKMRAEVSPSVDHHSNPFPHAIPPASSENINFDVGFRVCGSSSDRGNILELTSISDHEIEPPAAIAAGNTRNRLLDPTCSRSMPSNRRIQDSLLRGSQDQQPIDNLLYNQPPMETIGAVRYSGFPQLVRSADNADLTRYKPDHCDYRQRRERYATPRDESAVTDTLTGISMVQGIGSLGASHDTSCMEQLLVQCATAVESNDSTLAQQMMWVLNNIVSTEGDPNQRVTAYFLRALVYRAAKMAPNLANDLHAKANLSSRKVLSAIELAEYVDLTPWHRFGFSAANGAIIEAVGGQSRVHIVDFAITQCMQWPTLIESLANRPEGPPHIRLTVHGARPRVPPLLHMSLEELGWKLRNFARSKNVPFQFRVVLQEVEQLSRRTFDLHDDEALIVNCQMRSHYIPDETLEPACPRAQFLRFIRSLDPTMVTFVEEDANLTCPGLVARLRAAFNYLWIPFDVVDTFLPRDSELRLQYECDIGDKIENIIACEGRQRIERQECKDRWMQRIKKAHLQSVPFSEAVVAEVKSVLVEHATGWGLKKDEDALLLTWKGHHVVFAAACISAGS